ncbi:hypothetical protein [Salinibaculum rarum]|uniref:hypothetical protein n=1 Tax=Salinibaculum rarum TaxID=3058903 RepID=UPI00265E01C2|nr:hypothetical protein [Salinibaculum sp. KK48]
MVNESHKHIIRHRAIRALKLGLTLNLWLACLSALITTTTGIGLALPLRQILPATALPPLVFLFMYIEDRREITPDDHINHPIRTQLIEQHTTTLRFISTIAIVGYLLLTTTLAICAHGISPTTLVYILLAQTPIIFTAVYDSLKHSVPGVDTVAVAGTWVITTTYPIGLTATIPLSPHLFSIGLGWFCIIAAGVESRNINDIEGDAETDRETIAARLGATTTARLVVAGKALGVILIGIPAPTLLAPALATLHIGLLRLFRHLTDHITSTTA